MTDDFRLFVGVDWATAEHEVCALDDRGKRVAARSFVHSGDGLADLCAWLLDKAAPSEIAISIEVPHGAVVETLLDRGFTVFSINPKQLDRFRDRHTMPGAKDDRRDALVLADSLRTDMHLFRRLAQQPARVIELREWSRMHDELQAERGRIANQMRAQLARYFPAFLQLASDPAEDWAVALFERIPDQPTAQRCRPTRIAKLLKDHRIRRIVAEDALAVLRSTAPFSGPGVAGAAVAHLRLLGERARVLNKQLKQCKARLEELLAGLGQDSEQGSECEQLDATIIQTMPGVGVIVAATLLAEAAEPLREGDYTALRALTGVAPVTRRSGKKFQVVRRTACHPRLRNAVYHLARTAVQHDALAQTRYQALRKRGKTHGHALRCVADRMLSVLCAMVRTRTTYEARGAATAA